MPLEAVNTHLQPKTDPKFEQERIRKACAEFEALFLAQMLKTMRASGSLLTDEEKKDGLGLGTDNPFQDMFDWQLAMRLSMGSPLGIAKALASKYSPGEKDDADPATESSPPELRRFTGRSAPSPIEAAKPSRSARLPSDIDQIVADTARTFNLDPNLIRAVIQTESAGNPRAVSPRGAKGLMQLMDSTASDLGVENPFDPTENIGGGTAYLRKLLDRYKGDRRLALAAYNAGPGAVDRYKGIPPYPETVSYVRKVMQQISHAQQIPDVPKTDDKENQ